jgi:hydroxyquinol 1,2-dioxygenase
LPSAKVTVWQTAGDGRYDLQANPEETDCRGIFTADENGRYLVRTVRPLGYYIPLDGPVGQLVQAQGRHGMRPAHIHFLISAPGYRELVTALYLAGDDHLEDDVVFGASGDLVADVKHGDPDCPIKGKPSIRFNFSLSRETEADRLGGRVGADPAKVGVAA